MEKLVLLLFDICLGSIYLLGAFVIMILAQLISYKVFKINLYKKIITLIERG